VTRFVRPASRIGTLVSALLLAQFGFAGAQTAAPASTPATLADDRAVVTTIVMNAVTEVKLCGLALAKSQSSDIRTLCRRASADNARTAIQGMQLAQKIGASDAKLEPAPQTPEVLDSLAQYSGDEFDRKFIFDQIEDAENDEHSLRYAQEVATEAAVRHYEDAVLPTVEVRLDLAEAALRKMSETAP
jgi:predicted outer membrane protein